MDDKGKKKKVLTQLQAKLKIESYCAYQERAQQEVRDKLYEWGMHEEEVENIIADLIAENFLNEERFAKAFARGKFNLKGWGIIKIKQHLKAKRISDPLIKIALKEIDMDDYEHKLEELIEKKVKGDVKSLSYVEKAKLVRYLQSKGYDSTLIWDKLG